MVDVSINTVVKLLQDLGNATLEYQDIAMNNLSCKRLQCDEVWSFVYSKTNNVPEAHKGEVGYEGVLTWIAIDADTKLVPYWRVGNRDGREAYYFMQDLASRLAHRFSLKSSLLLLRNFTSGTIDVYNV